MNEEGGRMKGIVLIPPSAFLIHPFDLSGRDSSRQNCDCLGAWSSKRCSGLTPRPQSDRRCSSNWQGGCLVNSTM